MEAVLFKLFMQAAEGMPNGMRGVFSTMYDGNSKGVANV